MKEYSTLEIFTPNTAAEADLPLLTSRVSGEFPSPAGDFMDFKENSLGNYSAKEGTITEFNPQWR